MHINTVLACNNYTFVEGKFFIFIFIRKEQNQLYKDFVGELALPLRNEEIAYCFDFENGTSFTAAFSPHISVTPIYFNDDDLTSDFFRAKIFSCLANLEKNAECSAAFILPAVQSNEAVFGTEQYFLQSCIEGVLFSGYEFLKYKSEKKQSRVNVYVSHPQMDVLHEALRLAQNTVSGVSFARDLANESPSVLTPMFLAQRIEETLASPDTEITVWHGERLVSEKMGGIIAVGKGSAAEPCFITINYQGNKNSSEIDLAVVGKGITFDSGGISIKPAESMWKMKGDMSGAAAAAGFILSAQQSNLPLNIVGLIPAAENMLSSNAYRPGDIVVTRSGKSIHVDNTDAEGRIVLADALAYASELKPKVIIDLATLTGAVAVALGEFTGGLFSHNDEYAQNMYNAGLLTYERVWRLPLWKEYDTLIEHNIADINNTGGRYGGAITAAKFLEHFIIDKQKWIHLDIAGPAMPNALTPYNKKYLTGYGVRLLFAFAQKQFQVVPPQAR